MDKNKHLILTKVAMIVCDMVMVNLSYFLVLIVRFYIGTGFLSDAGDYLKYLVSYMPVHAVVCVVTFYLFRLYDTRWEFGGLRDMNRIIVACLITGVVYIFGTSLILKPMPRSLYLFGPFFQFVHIVFTRFGYKLYLEERNQQIHKRSARINAMVIGSDSIGLFAGKQIENSGEIKTVCMADVNGSGTAEYINGIPVIKGIKNIEKAISKYRIGFIVIADNGLRDEDRETVKKLCDMKGLEHQDFIEYLRNNNDTTAPVLVNTDGKARVIPFSPPDISDMEVEEVRKTLLSGWITTGPRTKELERRLAMFCHTSKVVCLNSATAAEELNFRICGIGEGDEVIVPAYTYTATASAAIHCGAKVVFADSMKDSCQMDYDKISDLINEKTKAIVAVDLGGIVSDYDKLYKIAEAKKNLFRAKEGNDLGARIQQALGRVLVFADCAHALGASRGGKTAGEIADFSSFSFHAVKNFTTAEGGAATWRNIAGIDNDEIYRRYQLLSLHGQSKDALAKTKVGAWEYDVVGPYYKCNMTDIMAAIGLRQLDRYPELLRKRREIIVKYDALCDELGVQHLNHYTEDSVSSGHLYLTRIPGINDAQRREIITKLAQRGVSTNVHYKPLPMMTAYKNLGWDIKDFPNAYAFYENLITLPLHTKLSNEDVDFVISNYREVVKEYL